MEAGELVVQELVAVLVAVYLVVEAHEVVSQRLCIEQALLTIGLSLLVQHVALQAVAADADGGSTLLAFRHDGLHQRGRQHLQGGDEAVVALHLCVHALGNAVVGQAVALEVHVLLRSLMAGIGEVEDVFVLLRIEHQAYLAALLHDVQHAHVLRFVHHLEARHVLLLLQVGGFQFYAKHG